MLKFFRHPFQHPVRL